jgi:hypothetical protein
MKPDGVKPDRQEMPLLLFLLFTKTKTVGRLRVLPLLEHLPYLIKKKVRAGTWVQEGTKLRDRLARVVLRSNKNQKGFFLG